VQFCQGCPFEARLLGFRLDVKILWG
jgi:hypothetical protein